MSKFNVVVSGGLIVVVSKARLSRQDISPYDRTYQVAAQDREAAKRLARARFARGEKTDAGALTR